VSHGWAKKISAARNRSGQAERVPHKPGRKPRVGAEQQKLVIAWVASQPDLTLAEIKTKLQTEAGITLGVTCLATAAKTESATEKKSLHAAERDTEANQKRREEFIAGIRMIAPERLIFLDESGLRPR
jgi:transposase